MSEQAQNVVPKHRVITSAIPSFLVQTLVATFAAMVIAVVCAFAIAALTAAVTENNSGGNFADHMAEQPVVHMLGEPYYPGPILVAFLLGAFSRRFPRSRSAAWVWILPAVVLTWNVFTWIGYGPPTSRIYWREVWLNYFSSSCGSSECLYELFVTAPFYTSVAYSVGWLTWKGLRRGTA